MSRKKYTAIGYFALLLWSFSASFAVFLKDLPPFQVLTVTFFAGFLFCLYKAIKGKKWSKLVSQPWYIWVVGVLGVCGQQMFYVLSFKYAPSVQADLVIYTWPIMVVVLSQFVQRRKNFKKTLFSAFLGFIGVALMMLAVPLEPHMELSGGSVWLGYGYAFACALIWSLYTVLSKGFRAPSEIVGFYGVIGSCIFLIGHLMSETYIQPTLFQWIVMVAMGLTVAGLAYYCWDRGIKKGNFQLLSILSYTNPILSIVWLFVFGLSDLHPVLLVSAALIIGGAFYGGVTKKQWRFIIKGVKQVRLFLRLRDRRSLQTVIRQQRVWHSDNHHKKRKKSLSMRVNRRTSRTHIHIKKTPFS